MKSQMTDARLASELEAIGQELEQITQTEQAAAAAVERQFAEDQAALAGLLESVQEAKTSGRWHNIRINVFEVLGRTYREQAHSSFLAWLLDPAEAHGLGDAFLRQFMLKAIGEAPLTEDVIVTPEYEWGDGKFDVHVEGDGWRLVVENKINDPTWPDQCTRYCAYCESFKKPQQAWLVYVTPHSSKPLRSIPYWLSYGDIRSILESLEPAARAKPLIADFCEHVSQIWRS
jgi:hypothetical protein